MQTDHIRCGDLKTAGGRTDQSVGRGGGIRLKPKGRGSLT